MFMEIQQKSCVFVCFCTKKGIIGQKRAYILRMKRKIPLTIISIAMLCMAIFSLCACNKKGNEQKSDNVSRTTSEYYAGESSDFAVTIEKGRRERTFIADGVATDVVDFCDITVVPLKTNDLKQISYVVSADDKTLSGTIDGGTYGEFCTSVSLDFVPKAVTITVGDKNDEIDMSSVLDGAITADDVINIAKTEFKDKLDAEYAQGKPEREIYLKLITADRMSYYYYVSFIGDGVDYWAMLVEPKTGAIITQK